LRRVYFIILHVCCAVFSLSAQEQSVDDLKNLLRQEEDPGQKITLLQSIANHYLLRKVHFDSAFYYGEQALQLAQHEKNTIEQGRSLFNLGRIGSDSGNQADAIAFYKRSLAICKSLDMKGAMAASYNNIGGCYFHLKDYKTAISYYKKAEYLHALKKDLHLLAVDAMNMGEAQHAMGDLAGAELNFLKSLGIIETLDWDPPTVHLYYARTLYALERIDEALEESRKAYDIAIVDSDVLIEAESAELMSMIYAQNREYELAYNFRSQAGGLLGELNLAKETNEIEKLKLNFKLQEQEKKLAFAARQNNYLIVIYVLVGLGVMLLVVLIFRQLKISRMTAHMHDIQTRLIEPELIKRETHYKEVSGFDVTRKQDENYI